MPLAFYGVSAVGEVGELYRVREGVGEGLGYL